MYHGMLSGTLQIDDVNNVIHTKRVFVQKEIEICIVNSFKGIFLILMLFSTFKFNK